ncbi:MAG: 4'-phosphopantetheinyl transferase superfamily protein [Oscillospiraceae bacterium]|jgi:4'-phosphopantetheinyl transferase|nr:4'-phosphopantetheinyl transferase superfamily protein [Oscillospiraceae bacterium]
MIRAAAAPRGALPGSAAVYALLARLVREEYGVPLPAVQKTPAGKPFFPDRPDIHFSLSHTVTHVLAAVSDSPVGVDVETVRPRRAGLAARVCSPEELALFDFFDLWVLKESCIKLRGGTLGDIFSLRFSRADGKILAPDPGVSCELYGSVPGCRAAVAVLNGNPPKQLTIDN